MEFRGSAPPEEYILPTNFKNIHLRELKHSTRRKTALHLNLDVVFNDDIGLEPNYRGLAELVGFSTLEIKNFELPAVRSPTEEVLDQWTIRDDLGPTVENFWNFIKELDRLDVLDDIWPFVERDCNKYLERQKIFNTKSSEDSQKPLQVHTVSQSREAKFVPETAHDVLEPGKPKYYDAFVCYNPEGEDLKFVQQLIRVLEDENNLRLFVPWRDDLAGTSHDTICAKLIEKRCKRMIIVLSPRFLESGSCEFQIEFAHSLSQGARSKKLVPIVIERCNLPEILRHVTCCDYTKKDVVEWFWRRLILTLKADLDTGPQSVTYDDLQKLERLNFDISMEVSWSSTNSSSTAPLSSTATSSSSSSSSSSSTSASNSSILYTRHSPGSQSNSVDSSSSSSHSSTRGVRGTSLESSSPTQSSGSTDSDYERIGNVGRTSRFRNFFKRK